MFLVIHIWITIQATEKYSAAMYYNFSCLKQWPTSGCCFKQWHYSQFLDRTCLAAIYQQIQNLVDLQGWWWPWHLGCTSLRSPSSLFFSSTTSSLLVLKVRIKTIHILSAPLGAFSLNAIFESKLWILITFAMSSSSRSTDHWRRPLAWRRHICQRNGSLPCKCPLHTSSEIPNSRWTLLSSQWWTSSCSSSQWWPLSQGGEPTPSL